MTLCKYVRVSPSAPCPVCGHDHWCRVTADHGLAVCNRVESPRPARGDGGGWLHIVGRDADRHCPTVITGDALPPKLSPAEWSLIDRQCQTALTARRLLTLSDYLGISSASLLRLGIGWHAELAAYTMPMRDDAGCVIGLRTRHADGAKRCVTGSRLGLIIPTGLDRDGRLDVLLIAEGESDCAVGLDLGFATIGRPGCGACGGLVLDLILRLRPGRVVLVADRDDAGQRGAQRLAERLADNGIASRVLTLPDHKDLRAWAAATDAAAHDLAARIDAPATRTEPWR